jgi:hypothetical protein
MIAAADLGELYFFSATHRDRKKFEHRDVAKPGIRVGLQG